MHPEDIVVLPELKAYTAPLTPGEHDALERSILAEGCRAALVLWGNILVDGHNRFGICQKHGLPFATVQNTRFQNMEDVHLWMIDQHLGRRSVSEFQRGVLALRIDENLFFGNITALIERVELELEQAPDARHVVLVLSAVNGVDYSALEGLEALDRDLAAQGIVLHLAEIKGPVLDRLRQSRWLDTLAGRIHPFAADALSALVDRSQTGSADDTIDPRQAR